ncbi:MAG: GAF domain-containing sensor histidine kinase [Chloroflexota bacterium]|nr:GAF domain-containing sensor histidine kinase [Chloroflexota bacterium]
MTLSISARVVEQEEILSRVAQVARQVVEADAAAVYLLDEDGVRLRMAAASGLSAALHQRELATVEIGQLNEKVLSGQPVIVADTRADPQAADLPGDYRSALCVPLMHESDTIGVLHTYAAAPGRFCERDAALLSPLTDLGAAAVVAVRSLIALEGVEASKAQFIHIATHELRSPLATAQSLVRGVLKGYAGPLADQQADLFGRISRRLDFLESLVNDLLELAAGKAAGLAEEEEPVLLNGSVGRAVLLLQPRAEEKGVALTLQRCSDRLVAQGTEDGLDRIFVNLVGNAVKYTPSGGSVTVAMQRLEDGIEVQVIDDGIGIPEEALPRLFEEFYRAPNAKASDEVGTGLGLAIVQDLVERYGGRIEVESRVGQGSTFAVTFPLVNL